MPSEADTQFSYGGLAGRVVGGQLRLFVHGRNPTGARAGITSGSSASTFAIASGQGASFHVGEKVNVVRVANGNNVPESRRIQSISGDQITLATPLGGVPRSGDTLYRDQDYYIYELADTGSYSTDYTQAPRMSLVTAWPDIFNGRRVTWRNGQLFAPMQYLVPGGMYWHEGNQLLYWAYTDAYDGSNHRNDWGFGATRLDDAATGASTSFGPWRIKVSDGDGSEWYGPNRGGYFTVGPDGKMAAASNIYNSALTAAYGPFFYGGGTWPTATTPSGINAPDLVLPDRYLEHYNMGVDGPNGFNPDGSVRGDIRTFRYPSSPARPYIYEGIDSPVQYADPAKTGGICTWTTLCGVTGGIWLELTQKRGVLYVASMIGSADANSSSVRAAHTWYRNTGRGNGTCKHGFGIPDVSDIAGPVTTASFPALIIYNPDDLRGVKAGSYTDYRVNPAYWMDLSTSFNIHTPPPRELARSNIHGFYFDSRRNMLFALSNQADTSNPGVMTTLIHVFGVNDRL